MTSSPKSNMEVKASLVRNSVRTSFQKIAPACLKNVTTLLFQKLFVLVTNVCIRSRHLFSNLPLVDKRPPSGTLESLLQIVRGHEHGLPVCYEGLQPFPEQFRSFEVQAGEGFVQQQDFRI